MPVKSKKSSTLRVLSLRTEDRGDMQIPFRQIYLATDDITVGVLFRETAGAASLGEIERLREFGTDAIEPVIFESAVDAREYLVDMGILDTIMLEHFPNMDATVTVGQFYTLLGSLYSTLIEKT